MSRKQKKSEKSIGTANYYSSKQLRKLRKKFQKFDWGYSFSKWNIWRQSDGLLCRRNYDCKWLNKDMKCYPKRMKWKIHVSSIFFSNFSFMFLNPNNFFKFEF